MRFPILALFALWSLGCSAQIDQAQLVDSSLAWFQSFKGEDDSLKIKNAQLLEAQLERFYSVPENFDVSFDTLNYLGQLTSKDEKLRLITFNIPLQDQTFKYYCLFVQKIGKDNSVNVHRLTEVDYEWTELGNRTISQNTWYGALYYRIITRKHKRKTYYTLLGWDGNTGISNIKIIDVVNFDSGIPLFGAPIFESTDEQTGKKKTERRLIYEYAEDANMGLNFQEDEDLIVMDHLAPEHPKLTGQYQFYGPDFSYDALQFKKGKWLLIRDHGANNRSLNKMDPNARPGDFKD